MQQVASARSRSMALTKPLLAVNAARVGAMLAAIALVLLPLECVLVVWKFAAYSPQMSDDVSFWSAPADAPAGWIVAVVGLAAAVGVIASFRRTTVQYRDYRLPISFELICLGVAVVYAVWVQRMVHGG